MYVFHNDIVLLSVLLGLVLLLPEIFTLTASLSDFLCPFHRWSHYIAVLILAWLTCLPQAVTGCWPVRVRGGKAGVCRQGAP